MSSGTTDNWIVFPNRTIVIFKEPVFASPNTEYTSFALVIGVLFISVTISPGCKPPLKFKH